MIRISLALTIILLICGFQQVFGAENRELKYDGLIEIARRYELPLPPNDAKLVLANTGWTTTVGRSSSSHDPSVYRPAFLLKRLSKGEVVLMGWRKKEVSSRGAFSPAIFPFSLERREPALKGYISSFENLDSFVTVVQLASLGRIDRATKLWAQMKDVRTLRGGGPQEYVAQWLVKPDVLLARCLFEFYKKKTLTDPENLPQIHKKLVRLKSEFPELFDVKDGGFYAKKKVEFIKDLGLSISKKKPAKGSVEALLLAWGAAHKKRSYDRFSFSSESEADYLKWKILYKGIKAIPALKRLCKDRRLTNHVQAAIMNAAERRLRLGELARLLLKQMTGLDHWDALEFKDFEATIERKFFVQAAIEFNEGQIVCFREVPLWILGELYPKALRAIGKRVCSKLANKPSLAGYVDAVLGSKLVDEDKRQIINYLADNVGAYNKREVLQRLAKIDEEGCAVRLLPIIKNLPSDVEDAFWVADASSYTHVVMELEQDEIWRAYLAVAKKAAIGLRMEMMNAMSYSYIGNKNRQRRLAFLVAFLADKEVRDVSVNGEKYTGPCAAFKFDKIQVRNFVAMNLSLILNLKVYPTEFWTAGQWEQLRDKVQLKLKGEKLPNLE